MKIKTTTLKLIFFFVLFSSSLFAQVSIPDKDNSGPNKLSLNGNWKFKYIPSVTIGNDSLFYKTDFNFKEWKSIKVPGQWELQGFAEPKYDSPAEGTGLYLSSFTTPNNWTSRQLFIVFDGVMYGYDLWINGKYVATASSSYNRHMFDITKYVAAGKVNKIAVKVTTRVKGWEFDTNDCWALSGIYRDVTLISVPKTHIKDFTVKTFITDKNRAKIDLSVILEKSGLSESAKNTMIAGKLFSPEGQLMITFLSNGQQLLPQKDTAIINKSMMIANPKLWTAETPWLYNLELTLKSNGTDIQKVHQKIGIRQVTIENGIFKLNGQAIKLRGTDHHDLDPTVGRALTRAMILKDLILIKKGNINFIRTSHYPPHPLTIDLCDSLGIYVMCEVPFGYGDKHLTDTTYGDILLQRAKATVWRDKNHPSIIIWSVGNENPLTPIALAAGRYVKLMDNTRPICYPQMGSYFAKVYKTLPEDIDVLSPHYGNAKNLENYAHEVKRPIIATEYAHALGLDMDKVETMWEVMYTHPQIAGGGVWMFFDQGLLRTSNKKVDRNAFTYSAWLDSIHYYDMEGNKGCDGLVYANRIPQVDYWEVRKVYAPVKALDDFITITPGAQKINIRINNRFDFKDLSDLKCKWTLTADSKPLQTGALVLKCNPHDTISLPVSITLPDKLTAVNYLLELRFYDQSGYQFTEKTYRLWYNINQMIDNKDLVARESEKYTFKDNGTTVSANSIFTLDKKSGDVMIRNPETKQILLEGPFARVGRKTTMSAITIRGKDSLSGKNDWNPAVLRGPKASVDAISASIVKCSYRYDRYDQKNEFIDGTVQYSLSNNGCIDVNYNFAPVNASGFFLEAGISFKVPAEYTEMRWIGNGPYASYPGKSMLNEYGFFHLNAEDLYFQGNRSLVQLMLFTDKNGNGFAINCNDADVCVERTPGGLLLSHNALVSGRFNKGTMPDKVYYAAKVKEIKGNFSIIPVNGNKTPEMLLNMFGKLSIKAVPFKPFYHSYDE